MIVNDFAISIRYDKKAYQYLLLTKKTKKQIVIAIAGVVSGMTTIIIYDKWLYSRMDEAFIITCNTNSFASNAKQSMAIHDMRHEQYAISFKNRCSKQKLISTYIAKTVHSIECMRKKSDGVWKTTFAYGILLHVRQNYDACMRYNDVVQSAPENIFTTSDKALFHKVFLPVRDQIIQLWKFYKKNKHKETCSLLDLCEQVRRVLTTQDACYMNYFLAIYPVHENARKLAQANCKIVVDIYIYISI